MDLEDRQFQDVLKELRTERNISQDRLAKDLDLTQNMIFKWEHGSTIHQNLLGYIADYFNVSVDYLIGRTMTRNNPMEKMNIMDKYKTVFSEDNILTDYQKKFLLEYLEEKHNGKK